MELWDGYSFGEKPNGSKSKTVVKQRIFRTNSGQYLKVLEFKEAFNQQHYYLSYTDDIALASRFPEDHVLDPSKYSNIAVQVIADGFKPQTIQITTEIDIVVIE